MNLPFLHSMPSSRRKLATAAALLLCLPLAACGERPQTKTPEADTSLGHEVRKATDQARKELSEQEAARATPDRLTPLRERVGQHERNIQALQKELGSK